MSLRAKRSNLAFMFALALLLAATTAWANREPPFEVMIGTGVEIPALTVPVAGGVISEQTGHSMSVTIGDAVSGTMMATDCGADQVCGVDLGYLVTEFYSDRVGISQVELRVNGGDAVTNQSHVQVEVFFIEDLSGLKSAAITDVQTGVTSSLNLTGRNVFFVDLPAEGLLVSKSLRG